MHEHIISFKQNPTQKFCKNLINLVMYSVFSFFLFFCIKNKWWLHTTYPKREVSFKAPKNLLFLEALLQSLTNTCLLYLATFLEL